MVNGDVPVILILAEPVTEVVDVLLFDDEDVKVRVCNIDCVILAVLLLVLLTGADAVCVLEALFVLLGFKVVDTLDDAVPVLETVIVDVLVEVITGVFDVFDVAEKDGDADEVFEPLDEKVREGEDELVFDKGALRDNVGVPDVDLDDVTDEEVVFVLVVV